VNLEGIVSQKISVNLGNVQKTMLLPLWGRAVETRKKHPLLVDETAVKVMEMIDYDFSTIIRGISPLSQYAWIMRSRSTDRIIKMFLKDHPAGTIVNIGCGLDTTFERVDNGLLRWYDLDMPDSINLRRHFIQESSRRTFIESSFLEQSWLKQIDVKDGVLFIAAGVLYYFDESDVKTFFSRLADSFPGCEIAFDASSEFGIKMANKLVIKRGGLDERSYLVWGLEHAEDIETWDPRYKVLEIDYYFKSNRQILPFNVWLIGLFSDSRRIQYYVHLRL
jgi:O-methyltransferase involved in polyketide biosynthesis